MGQLRSERDRCARALAREVGDEVPLERVLDEGSDWKGRAQQISLLRDKLREASSMQVHSQHQLLLGGTLRFCRIQACPSAVLPNLTGGGPIARVDCAARLQLQLAPLHRVRVRQPEI